MSRYIHYRNIFLSFVCVAIGVCMGYVNLTQENSGFPKKSELLEKSGYVDLVKKHKYGVRFSFVNDNMNFEYPSKSNGQNAIHQALIESKGKMVTILYDARNEHSPIYSEKIYYNYFELRVGEKLVRSYSESEQAWKTDNKLAPLLAVAIFLGGIYIWFKSAKEYKKSPSKAS